MNVDNTALLLMLMDFENENDFYYIEIIKRRKENPDLSKGSIKIIDFFIKSKEDLIKKYGLIKTICEYENARAYISVNKKSFKTLTNELILKLMKRTINNNGYETYNGTVSNIINSMVNNSIKKWIIDVDFDLQNDKPFDADELYQTVIKLQKEGNREPVFDILPTVNGLHVITRPFNLKKFTEKFPNISVHKNGLTLLYYKKNE